jgi:hypothetical protein
MPVQANLKTLTAHARYAISMAFHLITAGIS